MRDRWAWVPAITTAALTTAALILAAPLAAHILGGS